MNKADKRHKITQFYRQASMLLCVRNTVVSLRGTVERSTEHILHVPFAATSQKHLHFPQIQTKKQKSLNTLLESTLSVSQRVPYKARSNYWIFKFFF